jgi:hypothetical protein
MPQGIAKIEMDKGWQLGDFLIVTKSKGRAVIRQCDPLRDLTIGQATMQTWPDR